MKDLCREAGEKQASLMILSQQCDQVATKLSSDGAASLRGEMAGLRSSYVDVIQEARKELKKLSDVVTTR